MISVIYLDRDVVRGLLSPCRRIPRLVPQWPRSGSFAGMPAAFGVAAGFASARRDNAEERNACGFPSL